MVPKILIVYYSRTGTTKKLALALAKELNADEEELIDYKKRTWLLWYLGAGKDAALKKQTKIQEFIHDLTAYDIVVLGTPVWDFTMATAMRTFLALYGDRLPKKVAFFCTQAKDWAQEAFQDMAASIGNTPIATLACLTRDVAQENENDQLQLFLSKMRR